MAATKLTLRMDEEVIALGKEFARSQGTSLSKLLEQYIRTVITPPKAPVIIVDPDPDLASLMLTTGVSESSAEEDFFDEYYDNILDKHLEMEEE